MNPHTGEVLANRLWGRFAVTWVYDLHSTLLGGETGLAVVGVMGLSLATVLLTGILLWWPRRGKWRSALRLRLTASAQRRHYDLHKLLGLMGAAVLLVLAITGAALAFPSVVEPAVHALSAPLPMPVVRLPREAGQPLLPLDDVLERVRQWAPEGIPRWIDTPAADSAVLRVRLWLPGDPSRRFPRSYVWMSAHDGRILAVRDARHQSAGDTLLAWLHPLHSGEALGLTGRLLACLAGVFPVGLLVTGWLRWIDRRRAQRQARASRAAESSAVDLQS